MSKDSEPKHIDEADILVVEFGVSLKALRECFPCCCIGIYDSYSVFAVPYDMFRMFLSSYALEGGAWDTSKDADIIRDLLDTAGIPTDEQGGNDDRD